MPVKFQDYYATLGVPRDASAETIKLGFRKLARLHHPDVARDKVAGEARFKEINEAYEILGDPDKRRHYDELAAASAREATETNPTQGTGNPFARRPPQRSSPGDAGFEFGGAGFSDFYEAFFGGARSGPRVGSDVEADLAVTFEEALRGSRRQLSLRRPEATRAETYLVRIPAGVREGQRIRLAGQGSPGEDGAGSGDLLLRVRLARHPDFVADGDDLIHELDLAPWEAALGARIRIPTLGGEAWVRVPAGANDGLRLRLSGQGLPIDALKRGDLFAVVRLRVPSVMTPEERSLWENLARVATFHPRAVFTETQT